MTKRTISALVALLLLSLTACARSAPTADAPAPLPSISSSVTPRLPQPRIAYPVDGKRHYRIAAAENSDTAAMATTELKTPGLRYRVAVETDIHGLDPDDFAAQVSATLADPRGWRAPLRRVGPGQPYDFTIYLVTPGTRDVLCADQADGYTSCRNGDRVVLNIARWVKGVPRIKLKTYRQYMVNHEVGHRLGHGHEKCPGPGKPAPVMQQQTLGLHGCTPNPWPDLDGRRYAGVSGAYNDPVPPPDNGRK